VPSAENCIIAGAHEQESAEHLMRMRNKCRKPLNLWCACAENCLIAGAHEQESAEHLMRMRNKCRKALNLWCACAVNCLIAGAHEQESAEHLVRIRRRCKINGLAAHVWPSSLRLGSDIQVVRDVSQNSLKVNTSFTLKLSIKKCSM
jgi:hypothetical protein